MSDGALLEITVGAAIAAAVAISIAFRRRPPTRYRQQIIIAFSLTGLAFSVIAFAGSSYLKVEAVGSRLSSPKPVLIESRFNLVFMGSIEISLNNSPSIPSSSKQGAVTIHKNDRRVIFIVRSPSFLALSMSRHEPSFSGCRRLLTTRRSLQLMVTTGTWICATATAEGPVAIIHVTSIHRLSASVAVTIWEPCLGVGCKIVGSTRAQASMIRPKNRRQDRVVVRV